MNIGIIGLGNDGLLFGLLCESKGHNVIVTDENENLLYNLNNKLLVGKDTKIQQMVFESKNFSATTENIEVIEKSDVIFTFVPTPSSMDDKYDTTKVFESITGFYSASSLEIPLYNKKFIVCSTTNPGEVTQLQQRLSMFNIQVGYVPTFPTDSSLLIIGTEYQELASDVISIFNDIKGISLNAFVMSITSSEVAKMFIESFITLKINYANMVGEMMMKLNLQKEIDLVLNSIGSDNRIGNKNLKYGFGYGGPSLPKSNRAIIANGKDYELNTSLIKSNEEFNKSHAEFLKNYYIRLNPNKNVPFVLYGLSYKVGANNIDESQKFQLCIDLLTEGYSVNVVDSFEITNTLNKLSETYDGRLKFYNLSTQPEGFKIDLI